MKSDTEGALDRPMAMPRFRAAPVLAAAFLPLVGALMLVDLYLIFMWAPTATSEHRFNLQRIFYFHVPIAWVALLAYFFVFLGSVLYLWKRETKWDTLAHSAAEIGLVFSTLVIVTGSIWAKGIWGKWWTWEPRLTTMLILWLIYVAYLMLRSRSYTPSPEHGARYAAVLGVVGFIDVPIVYFAANWWRGLHPEVVTGPLADSGSLDSSMRVVLWFSAITFAFLFAFLMRERMSLRRVEHGVRQLRHSLRRAQNDNFVAKSRIPDQ